MSINKKIVELHSELQRLVDREELYFSESHRKFIVTKRIGEASYYNELPPKYAGLIYETCWGTESTKVDVCDEPSPDRETNIRRVLYSTDVLLIEKLYVYGKYHTQSVEAAVYFAARHHGEQVRKSNYEPYVLHLLEVLNLIKSSETAASEATLIAAVLHDVIEDTHVTKESIEFLFGSDVAIIVEDLTCEDALTFDEKKPILLDKIKMASDSAKIIKMADVISNIGSLPKRWTDIQKKSYLDWCDQVATVCAWSSENLYRVYSQEKSTLIANGRF